MAAFKIANFKDLIGLTFDSIISNDDSVCFNGKRSFTLVHQQDCCERVYLADVTGDLSDLVGLPILMAEEAINPVEADHTVEGTWSFYKLATSKGYVTLRFLGTSNGYYSESVSFYEKNEECESNNEPACVPAPVELDLSNQWYSNGKYHREDGPAIEVPIKKETKE